jgi:hypothetical protein
MGAFAIWAECVNLLFEELIGKSATVHELHSVLEAYFELSVVAGDDL